MRARLTLDDDLVQNAKDFTGITEMKTLVYQALKCLVEREASRRMALLGGTMPDLEDIPRRRSRMPRGSQE